MTRDGALRIDLGFPGKARYDALVENPAENLDP